MSARHPSNRLNHFRKGVEAFSRLGLPAELAGLYMCPLCMRGCREVDAGELTLEHVPPRSVGGKRLLLTCRDCNSRAGGPDGVDTHARKQEDFADLLFRSVARKIPARLTVGLAAANIEIRSGQQHIELIQGEGPPGEAEGMRQVFERMASEPDYREPLHLSLHYSRYKIGWSEVAWLRVGYLAVFAALGYRYICREKLILSGESVPWPRKPEFALDFAPAGELMNRILSCHATQVASTEGAC